MDEAALGIAVDLAAMHQHALKIVFGDFTARERHLDADGLRGRIAAGEIEHHFLDRLAGHLFGGVDGGEDRHLRLFHVDDRRRHGHRARPDDRYRPRSDARHRRRAR